MKIQLCIDAIPVAESVIDTSPGTMFEALEILGNTCTEWSFRLDPTELSLEPRVGLGGGAPVPYYNQSTLIQVRLLP